MQRRKIVMTGMYMQDRHIERLREAVGEWATLERVSRRMPEADRIAAYADAEIVLGWPDPADFPREGIQLVQLGSVGYDAFLSGDWLENPSFTLCNASGVMPVQIAEHVLAMILGLARNIPQSARNQQSRTWNGKYAYKEIHGSTACVIGLGDIGTEIVRKLQAIGVRVVGVRKSATAHPLADKTYPSDRLREAVREADHVIVVTPGGEETQRLIDADAIRAMKEGACFYNVGRGTVADQQALIEALQAGRLGGAGLDVFEEEPLPADSPLWSMDNVIVTPHVAGRSEREYDRMTDLFIDNLERYRSGRPLRNVIAEKGRP